MFISLPFVWLTVFQFYLVFISSRLNVYLLGFLHPKLLWLYVALTQDDLSLSRFRGEILECCMEIQIVLFSSLKRGNYYHAFVSIIILSSTAHATLSADKTIALSSQSLNLRTNSNSIHFISMCSWRQLSTLQLQRLHRYCQPLSGASKTRVFFPFWKAKHRLQYLNQQIYFVFTPRTYRSSSWFATARQAVRAS